jgi:hypothetical protein
VNADTGEFRALTERVAELERRLQDIATIESIMARAGMPPELREVADRESRREARHLRAVE